MSPPPAALRILAFAVVRFPGTLAGRKRVLVRACLSLLLASATACCPFSKLAFIYFWEPALSFAGCLYAPYCDGRRFDQLLSRKERFIHTCCVASRRAVVTRFLGHSRLDSALSGLRFRLLVPSERATQPASQRHVVQDVAWEGAMGRNRNMETLPTKPMPGKRQDNHK